IGVSPSPTPPRTTPAPSALPCPLADTIAPIDTSPATRAKGYVPVTSTRAMSMDSASRRTMQIFGDTDPDDGWLMSLPPSPLQSDVSNVVAMRTVSAVCGRFWHASSGRLDGARTAHPGGLSSGLHHPEQVVVPAIWPSALHVTTVSSPPQDV